MCHALLRTNDAKVLGGATFFGTVVAGLVPASMGQETTHIRGRSGYPTGQTKSHRDPHDECVLNGVRSGQLAWVCFPEAWKATTIGGAPRNSGRDGSVSAGIQHCGNAWPRERGADPETSWTASVQRPREMREKFGEEAVEAIIEAVKGDREN